MENQININLKIAELLAKGLTQKEASDELKRLGIVPNSLSSIEKKLKSMRSEYEAKTVIHLFVKLTKKGLI